MSKTIFYVNAPHFCDICSGSFENTMYDGRTVQGPWANMCESCFKQYGVGLGLGRGQKYTKKEDRWYKV